MKEIIIGRIDVCVCCMLAHAADGCGDCAHDQEPLSMITPPHTVTMGLLIEEHEDRCPKDRDVECDCEGPWFSWERCEGCGSGPGGDRYAFTLWGPAPEQASS